MRDKLTMRGRGFGFVKMVFKDEEEASRVKEQVINKNAYPGHHINDKQVDVKSADDFHEKKPMQSPFGGMGGGFPGSMGAGLGGGPMGGIGPGGVMGNGLQKPNPYAIPETK